MTSSRRRFLAGAATTALMGVRTPVAHASPPPGKVLVIGGTGRVGAIAVRRFVAAGFPVGFTTRSAQNVDLFGPAALGVVTDLNDRDALERAFAGYTTALMIIANGDNETAQGLNCLAALRQAGVRRVAYLSVVRSLPAYGIKAPIERALADWGVPSTILRPNYFFQNDLLVRRQVVDEGVYPQPMGLIGVSRIDCRDIVEVAFQGLTARDHGHHDDELHGPQALTGPDVAALFQGALGKPVRYFAELPEAERAKYVFNSERGRSIAAYWAAGQAKATPEAVAHTEKLVGRPLRRFADFVPEALALWRGKSS
jgi:uncharacterized protein YbjT (DUF2867 family)